jgi:hypothetical protein
VLAIIWREDKRESRTEPAVFPICCSCKAEKAGMLNDIELARDVVATERGSCRGTVIEHERNPIVKAHSATIQKSQRNYG